MAPIADPEGVTLISPGQRPGYAFCQRAHDCGYRVLADTTVRLFHIGKYGFGWEDAGIDRQRYPTFTLHLEGQPEVLKRD